MKKSPDKKCPSTNNFCKLGVAMTNQETGLVMTPSILEATKILGIKPPEKPPEIGTICDQCEQEILRTLAAKR